MWCAPVGDMAESRPRALVALIIVYLLTNYIHCYEKNLRNIVRNRSKMVHRPFSDVSSGDLSWKKASGPSSGVIMSGSIKKTMINKHLRPRISSFMAAIDTSRGKLSSTPPNSQQQSILSKKSTRELLSSQNSLKKTNVLFPDVNDIDDSINNMTQDISIQNFYQVMEPQRSPVFGMQPQIRAEDAADEVAIPEYNANNNTAFIKALYLRNAATAATEPIPKRGAVATPPSASSEVADYLIPLDHTADHTAGASFTYNTTSSAHEQLCSHLLKTKADIDAQETFLKLNIEPPWMAAKTYWRSIFESRYTSLMRSPKWPPLNVILMPRTHVDTIWRESFEEIHNKSVHKIISSMVKKLSYFKNMTFTWNEVSHLSEWWRTTTTKNRMLLRRLCRHKRLEITTGGWVEPDQATAHLFGLLHQLMEGHQWLKSNLNYRPSVAWSGSVAHGPTLAYLLAACGVPRLVLARLHYAWEEHLADYQQNDFIWLQSWPTPHKNSPLDNDLEKLGSDRLPAYSVLTHVVQFHSGFSACGPNGSVCETEFDFSKRKQTVDINAYNVKDKAERLLEQFAKAGTTTPHNVVLAPFGGSGHFETQAEFDQQYVNYKKIADFVNANSEVYKATIKFGTPRDLFNTMSANHKTFPTLTGDFVNFADVKSGTPAYWSGYFTTRPLLKMRLRRLEATLRSTEILASFAVNLGAVDKNRKKEMYKLLLHARVSAARAGDGHAGRGTLPLVGARLVHERVLSAVRTCWRVQELAASLLTIRPGQNHLYLKKYVYREGEYVSIFRSVSAGDQIYLFNSLSQERTEIVELITRSPNIRIVDHNKQELTIQVNPMWRFTASEEIDVSKTFYKVLFVVKVSPLTLALMRVSNRHEASAQLASVYCFPLPTLLDIVPAPVFQIQPTLPGDIQLESYKHRLVFDEITGLLKLVVEKETDTMKHVGMHFGAFRASDVNSGMFLFNTQADTPIEDFLSPYKNGEMNKSMIIISGPISTELTTIFGNFIHSSVKIFNLIDSQLSRVIYLETKVDYELSPKHRDLELFMSIQTSIANGQQPEIVTDNNGFQYTTRKVDLRRRVKANLFPVTSMAFIQDQRSRATLVTDHAQAVTALRQGQLVVLLDRRVLFDDNRGVGEGLADSSATFHRHYLILENLYDRESVPKNEVVLPSLTALRFANELTYPLDSLVVDRNISGHSYYGYLPLIKTPFPCDVSLVNFRSVWQRREEDSAFLVLHRQTYSCQVAQMTDNCATAADFTLTNIFHKVKSIFQTNLCGTTQGTECTTLDKNNFPPMELVTLHMYFENSSTPLRSPNKLINLL